MVPHPALGFPTSIALTYKSYNGWLSRGLQFWNVYKVVITDSYGQSYSICKRFFSLESGVPVKLDLQPGNCHIAEEVYELDELPPSPPVPLDRVDGDKTEYNKYETIKLGNYGLTEEENSSNLPWSNLIDGNALEKESTETSRGFDTTDAVGVPVTEVFEPVLRKDRPKHNKGRNLEGFQGDGEIVEPILKSTTARAARDQVRAGSQQNNRKSREEQGFLNVQLFPFRLGELLERAERYARQTLLPFISDTAPRLFGFGTVVSDEHGDRKGRELAIVTHEQIEQETKPKNIYESLRESSKNSSKVVQSRSISDVKFYSNENDLTVGVTEIIDLEKSDSDIHIPNERRGHQISLDDIRIDLPTYKPPAKTIKDFPYEFIKPGEELTKTTSTTSAPLEKKDRVDRSWIKFDIPVFRALSRSLQGFALGGRDTTSTTTPPATEKEETEDDHQMQTPSKRFIPLEFGGGFR